ncbi:2-polyprenyl-6-methoxyphenol hydroxylase-like FAD-dependent oxidoreductase [Frondihabitans sp. PhB188]|uniref:FAD-dependent monooxygenase n=1 Tax=Frondihabitans sp. PhB188 TaxID=2485200 RepID=UPI000F4A620A|nr:FAD-dependent monooxygenase [Frondihabitans sp. PhB188]ROQ36795.1 2-polyprenyl-6-methoxyphenol hydroxylase-like FAD-dependent oxidoreductase [Frondihabitans sp. PhB188]
MNNTKTQTTGEVLISGASFAGLTTAIWMQRLGYRVTIVERAAGLRKGGTPVDLRNDAMMIFDRLGLLPAVRARALPARSTEFAHVDGTPIASMGPEPTADTIVVDDYEIHRHDDVEIHRDDLLAILFAEVEKTAEILFGESIAALTDTSEGVRAEFRGGPVRDFALVVGCDGNHSGVRGLRFGPEPEYSHFLHHYTSVTVVDGALIAPWTSRIQNTPGRTLLLNSYDTTTDVVLVFQSDDEIAYDYHDVDEQKQLIRDHFADAGEPFSEAIVDKALGADNFYFDKLSQIRLPGWSSGRVTLVGDAAYCPSPAAGMGGSVAILGATALHDAFVTAGGDIEIAFAEYERSFRPTAEKIQTETEQFGLPMIFPDTAEAIEARNAQLLEM